MPLDTPVSPPVFEDGIINTDDPRCSHWGFTSENFGGMGSTYAWHTDGRIMLSLVNARHPGQGHFSRLVKAIEADGFAVAVPTPFAHMRAILTKWGFKSYGEDGDMGMCEVMMRPEAVARKRAENKAQEEQDSKEVK